MHEDYLFHGVNTKSIIKLAESDLKFAFRTLKLLVQRLP